MIKSMTGFGAADGPLGGTTVSVEIRSVNHRFFSPTIKLPSALSRWEADARELLRSRLSRGHVTLTARVERPQGTAAGIDEAVFAERASALRSLKDRHGLGGEVDVATVLRMPDVFRSPSEEAEAVTGTAAEFTAVLARATDALDAARVAEGSRLVEFIRARLLVVEGLFAQIAARSPERVQSHQARVRERVQALLRGVALDEQRLAQEVAILAERLDVAEEVDRFTAHVASFRETLARGAEGGAEAGVGKRLGFLLQEMLREVNTTGSKANDAATQRDVIAVKEELERIREQVENLE